MEWNYDPYGLKTICIVLRYKSGGYEYSKTFQLCYFFSRQFGRNFCHLTCHKFTTKRSPFRPSVGTQRKAISVANWLLNEGCFDSVLAPKGRHLTCPISAEFWHLNQGYFGGELATKGRPFR